MFGKKFKKAAAIAMATTAMVLLTGCPSANETRENTEETIRVVYPDPDREVHLHTVMVTTSDSTWTRPTSTTSVETTSQGTWTRPTSTTSVVTTSQGTWTRPTSTTSVVTTSQGTWTRPTT